MRYYWRGLALIQAFILAALLISLIGEAGTGKPIEAVAVWKAIGGIWFICWVCYMAGREAAEDKK